MLVKSTIKILTRDIDGGGFKASQVQKALRCEAKTFAIGWPRFSHRMEGFERGTFPCADAHSNHGL